MCPAELREVVFYVASSVVFYRLMSRRTITLVFIFILGGITGYLFTLVVRPLADSAPALRAGGFTFINPLLLCSASEHEQSDALSGMRTRLGETVARQKSLQYAEEVGVYFRYLDTGEWLGINEDKKFTPGSLLKLPVLIAYLKKAETNPGILSQQYIYEGTFDQGLSQNFKPEHGLIPGKQYSVEELLRSMMEESDNNAAQILMQHVDAGILDKTYAMLQFSPPETPLAINFISPRTFSYFLRVLYNSSYLTAEMSEKALALMSGKNFQYGIRSAVPETITVADKFGERILQEGSRQASELHDCGIIYYPGRPYLLCVMTRGSNLNTLPAVLKDVSAVVYSAVEAQSQSQ